MGSKGHIAIVGGGLVGSVLSIYLAKGGYRVSVFERRPDMRASTAYAGRSINLALSSRGLLTLEEVGVAEKIKPVAIPMHGRMVHGVKGNLNFLPYGKEGQYINSVSRADLNEVLINAAEEHGASFFFEHRCTNIDFANTEIEFATPALVAKEQKFDLIIGADGAYSAVRSSMQITDRFNYSQYFIDHGYKELHIPATANNEFQLEPNALHIWPRDSFMMIALPNPDGSFTCTLFFAYEGTPSFSSLDSEAEVSNFFRETFPDAAPLMPNLLEDYKKNPVSSLVTIKCFPWVRNRTLLIGDAAHAIVPFYGQGMNAGFEDCRILNGLLNEHNNDWDKVFTLFQQLRTPDTDAIAELAFDNFVEMRDLVADPEFILRKKIEAKLHEQFPNRWIPLYGMVTFSPHIRYSNAYAIGQKQKSIMDKVLQRPDIESSWQNMDLTEIIKQLD